MKITFYLLLISVSKFYNIELIKYFPIKYYFYII